MKVSSQLQSQLFDKNVIGAILVKLGRTNWEKKYTVHDLTIEAWGTGIWVKEAGTIISYTDLNNYWRNVAENIGETLPVTKINIGWLVKSRQFHKSYLVTFGVSGWQCECMRWRCWNNRISSELEAFWRAIDEKPYCHHTAAAYLSTKAKSAAMV